MSVAPATGFTGEYTIDDLDDLDLPPGSRVEIIDGSLHVTPPPAVDHQFLIRRLRRTLESTLPEELVVIEGLGVGTARRYLVPDLMVIADDWLARAAERQDRLVDPIGVRLAIEIVSPSSRTHDWVTKPNTYPALGIGAFWILDPQRRELGVGLDAAFTVHPLEQTPVLTTTVGGVPVELDLAAVLG